MQSLFVSMVHFCPILCLVKGSRAALSYIVLFVLVFLRKRSFVGIMLSKFVWFISKKNLKMTKSVLLLCFSYFFVFRVIDSKSMKACQN